jgi:hypothetical protein
MISPPQRKKDLWSVNHPKGDNMAKSGCAPQMGKSGGKAGGLTKGAGGKKGGFVTTPANMVKKGK